MLDDNERLAAVISDEFGGLVDLVMASCRPQLIEQNELGSVDSTMPSSPIAADHVQLADQTLCRTGGPSAPASRRPRR